MKEDIKFIGLTGTNGSGKGEAAAFFQNRGFAYFSLSDLIREELLKEGLEPTRDNLIKKGNSLRTEGGADVLARMVLRKVKGKAVIDSIRNPDEVGFLKREKNFILLAIDAPVEIRYERVKRRGRDESVETLRAFMEKEAEEMTRDPKGQQLQTCMEMADFRVINEGSLEEFRDKLEKFL